MALFTRILITWAYVYVHGYSKWLSGVLTTCHLVLQMQPHVISFYGVTSMIRFMFRLFPQVSQNWRYESEPPLKPSPLTCYKQFGTNSIIVLMFVESQRVYIWSTCKVCNKTWSVVLLNKKYIYSYLKCVVYDKSSKPRQSFRITMYIFSMYRLCFIPFEQLLCPCTYKFTWGVLKILFIELNILEL